MGDMSIPLQFASLYDGQEVFVWSSCLLDLGTDFLVGYMVIVYPQAVKCSQVLDLAYQKERVALWCS